MLLSKATYILNTVGNPHMSNLGWSVLPRDTTTCWLQWGLNLCSPDLNTNALFHCATRLPEVYNSPHGPSLILLPPSPPYVWRAPAPSPASQTATVCVCIWCGEASQDATPYPFLKAPRKWAETLVGHTVILQLPCQSLNYFLPLT